MADFLSTLMQMLWTGGYIAFVLTSGWTIMKGYRGYLTWYMRLLGRLGMGFLALICTIGLAPLIPLAGSGIFKMIFYIISIVVAGIITTLVITVSLILISDKIYNIRGMEKSLERLKLKIEKAKSFEKEMAGKSKLRRIFRPVNIIGIVILAVFLAVTLANFSGFPDPAKNLQDTIASVLTEQGVNPEMLKTFCDLMENYNQSGSFSENCAGPIEIAQSFNVSLKDIPATIISQLPFYVDSGIKTLIESNSKESVEFMYRVQYRQNVYALAITNRQSLCSATGTQFCGCVNLGTI